MLENTKGAIKNRHSRETGNIGYTRRRKIKQKHNTISVGHHFAQTTINNIMENTTRISETRNRTTPKSKKLAILLILLYA
jgi:hypothetical protein